MQCYLKQAKLPYFVSKQSTALSQVQTPSHIPNCQDSPCPYHACRVTLAKADQPNRVVVKLTK